MKFGQAALLSVVLASNSANAFTNHYVNPPAFTTTSTSTSLNANNNDNAFQKMVSASVASAILWGSTTLTGGVGVDMMMQQHQEFMSMGGVSHAKEMASGSGSRVNKDAESLLRYGLPIQNKEVRKFQATVESIKQDIASKRKSAALDGVKKSRQSIKKDGVKMTASCREASTCQTILSQMELDLAPLEASLIAAQDSLNGSDQERAALDEAYKGQEKITKQLTTLEEQMVPAGYERPVPSDYADLPQLKGRATVEFVLKKPDNEQFDIEGKLYKEAKMTMVIDGFTAPVTSGNFVELVDKGFYTNMAIQRSDGFVVQTGDPDGPADGYTGGKPSKAIGKGKHGERLIPTEILVVGDKENFYESTIEDEGRGGEATVLPFSSYGAMGWARDEYEVNSGSSQFFWLLFDSDLTPAGKNVLDGRYPCFGYVTEGADFLRDIKEGDIITTAKVTSGIEKLVLPAGSAEPAPVAAE